MQSEFFIPHNTPSSKNSRRLVKGGRFIASKQTMRWRKLTEEAFVTQKDAFRKALKKKKKPYKIGFFFIRDSKRKFDWVKPLNTLRKFLSLLWINYTTMKNLPRAKYSKVSGIYCLKSTTNSKVYYGSAKDLYKRVNLHKRQLEQGKHENTHLQNHYDKYGEASLVVEVLEVLPSCKKALLVREQYYIDTMLNDWEQCFNISKIAGTPDTVVTEKMRENLRKAWRDDYERRAAIVRKNIEIARKFHKPPNPLNWVGRKHSNESKFKMSVSAKNRGAHKSTLVPVLMLSLNNEPLMQFNSLRDACRFLNVPVNQSSNIGAVCRNKREKAFGFKWTFDPSKKSRELLETPEEDNQQPMPENSIEVSGKVQRLDGEELTNNPSTSAGLL